MFESVKLKNVMLVPLEMLCAADGQVVVIERRDRLRTSAVEVNGTAGDRMTNRSAGREHVGDTNGAGGFQYLREVTEGEITVVERPHVLAVAALVVVDGAGWVAGNAAASYRATVVEDEGLIPNTQSSGR